MKKININKEWGMLVIAFLLGVAVTFLVAQLATGGQLYQGWLTSSYSAPARSTIYLSRPAVEVTPTSGSDTTGSSGDTLDPIP